MRIRLYRCLNGGYVLVPAVMRLPLEAEEKYGYADAVCEVESHALPSELRKWLLQVLHLWHYVYIPAELGMFLEDGAVDAPVKSWTEVSSM